MKWRSNVKNITKQLTLSLKNPFIYHHVVYGQHVLPGLAYIDMIYQIFREHGYSFSELQLRNLSIYQPLTARQDSVTMLDIDCTEKNEGHWQITVKGFEKRRDKEASDEKLYMKADMHTDVPAVFEETLELNHLKATPDTIVQLDEVYEQCRRQELVHSGYMKANGHIYEEEEGVLLDLSLGSEAMLHAEGFMFHPALIDGSGVGANNLLTSLLKGEQRLFLPLFYESFSASALLQTHCMTRIKRSSVRQEKELIYVTLEFFNASGEKVAELKNFTSKLVREAELIHGGRKDLPQSQEARKDTAEFSQAAEGIKEVSSSAESTGTYEAAEQFVSQLIADKINKPVEQIEKQVGYYQMGLNSSGLLEVVETISDKIGESLSPTLLFEHTTIAELSAFLAQEYGEHFTASHSIDQNEQKRAAFRAIDRGTAESRKRRVHEDSARTAPLKAAEGDIAIIGMAGRYPNANNINDFWNNLKEGMDCISEIPESRWDVRRFEGITSPSGKSISKWGGFIDNPDCFDPQFFRITPREAETMDPQERLFLETCWETIEDAGYTPKTLATPRGRNKRQHVGVFAGVMHKDYTLVGAEAASKENVFPLSLNYAQIANRVSYFCNFHGPSMAVDTVCSSSLTAVHLALESLRHGECEVALAGGVNLSLHPNKYMTYGVWDMFSTDGHCRTFGKDGDGYVPAEGIGAVLLKPLRQAEKDGDRIYAVIKGSAVNHVGTVSGISVPSPVSQADLIETCLEKTGIDPRTVSYVEAHGTGTSLGDPIELQGLVKAFRQYTEDRQFCSIGSVKSNIGHAESAAGISGLSKVALQLHHQTLVPSLHSEELNPYVDFEKSPFYVQHKTETWKQPVINENGEGIIYPRRASISSFGATGSNAHMILEEYIPKAAEQTVSVPDTTPVILPLSARNQERLHVYAERLLDFLHEGLEIRDVAYTLQIGREPMEERVAFLAGGIQELRGQLEAYLKGQETIEHCWKGRMTKETGDISLSAEIVHKWLEQENLNLIAEKWAGGSAVDWKLLYGENKPKRISLPTYPFAKVRYWVPEKETETDLPKQNLTQGHAIHPLLHENVSDMSGVRFRSEFTGREFFLKDHVIKGQHILPGAALLEMVRAAAEKAAANQMHADIRLQDIVWIRPVAVTDLQSDIYIHLYPEDNGDILFEICRESDSAGEEPVIYGQGSVVLCQTEEAPKLNIEEVKASCSRRILPPSVCYDAYAEMGIEYGDGHRAIDTIYVGANEALAKLSLPSVVSHTQDHYVLHPSMIDAAFQASIGLRLGTEDASLTESQAMLPFALQDVQIFKDCEPSMWARVKYSEDSTAADRIQKLDIDLCNEAGQVCVRMKGYSARTLENETDLATGILLFEHIWEEAAVSEKNELMEYQRHKVIVCDMAERQIERIRNKFDCTVLEKSGQAVHERFKAYALQLFEDIQQLLNSKPGGNVLVQVAVPALDEPQLLNGLAGLLKTAQLENPAFNGQLIEFDSGISATDLAEKLAECRQYPHDNHIRYWQGKRYVSKWKEAAADQPGTDMPWKDKGVYLITGGAGGLGFLFANEIANKTREAVMILTGRSPLNERKQSQLQKLQEIGARVVYRQTDMTEKEAVYALTKEIQEEYGGLNGIIHSAGIIKDNFIIKKKKDEIQDVLAPKVTGLIHLDEATKDIPLDFFILFSSNAGTVGSAGQADYAMANAFMNTFSEYRNVQAAHHKRYGKTLAMSWPLWKDGGMHVDAETERMLTRDTGMVAMETDDGIQALYHGWASGKSQLMVAAGAASKIHSFLDQTGNGQSPNGKYKSEIQHTENASSVMGADEEMLREKAEDYFKSVLSSVTKLPVSQIDAEAPMEDYGIDSIMIMHVTGQLEKVFGSLSKTLFFEYLNIRSLSQYFTESHREKLLHILGIESETSSSIEENRKPDSETEEKKEIPVRRRKPGFVPMQRNGQKQSAEKETEEIAIIGISGRYPQADNIHELWKNLRDGHDCITEIPEDRWDHSLYYDKDKDKPEKTYSKWGGFIKDVDKFDPQFFHISPREAKLMDPQERLFLQCVYETMEDAGYTREHLGRKQDAELGGNVGVYVGVMYEEYQLYGAQEQARGRSLALPGNPSSVANRVSYYFDFHGPSMALDTMCSSSLTAIHLACQSLQRGECEAAFAGGVNVSIHPNKYLMLGQNKFMSSKGRCESFGQGGDGYVPGEGVGAVLLKPLSKAIEDGDHIYGVIKGTAINHGGKTNGYSVPNPKAQAEVIKKAVTEAQIDPRAISYIEAHGTGTSLGDPIEITGLAKVFSEHTKDKQFCAIGSAKSNIGHCESAAGIAGLTKVLLQMKYRQLAPSLHSKVLNPNIDFFNSPFKVQQELEEWKKPIIEVNGKEIEYPRIAGLSSFGAGGGNAHILIEEYASKSEPEHSSAGQTAVIVLSAKNEERLQKRAERLLDALREGRYSEADLPRIAYTLQVGREAMNERLAFVAENMQELKEKLNDFISGKEHIDHLYRGQVKRNKETIAVFAADEDMAKTIEAWVRKGKFAKLLDLWVKGLNIDWNMLYQNGKPRRISLPAYPFARDRYWIEETVVKTVEKRPVKPAVTPQSVIQAPFIPEKVSDKPANISLQPLMASSQETPQSTSVLLQPVRKQQTITAEVLCDELSASLADVLYMDQNEIDPDEAFIDIGMDSITGLEWIKSINKKFGTSLLVTKVYDYPTIRDFAAFLKDEVSTQADGENAENHPQKSEETYTPNQRESISSKPDNISLQPLGYHELEQQKPVEDIQYAAAEISASSQYAGTIETLNDELKESIAEVLCMDSQEVDIDDTFIDIGMDSITGLEWIKAINKQYGTSFSVTKVYDYPTIRQFANMLKAELVNHSNRSKEIADELFQENKQPEAPAKAKPAERSIQPVRLPAMKAPEQKPDRSHQGYRDDAIAIVGMAGRYPGAKDVREYWDHLVNARNAIRDIPKSRWDVDKYYDPALNQKGKVYCKSLGMLDDIEHFDPLFFNIPPSEAELIDPQHRIFLQEGYKAFEDAGYNAQTLSSKKCGVYLGIMSNEYGVMLNRNQARASATGNSFAIAAARIPYYLNLKGPAIPIDTACSSSLVGTHLARQALVNKEIDMALVGGVTLYLTPESYISMCEAGMLSPDGQCKAFDNGANGFVPGEGAGALVLKRLKDAEADRDHIYGVIIGSGINQDGKTNGITAPSVKSQMDLERDIYETYGIHPESISYVEMHGTGTKQGDPIELEALSTVFKEKTDKKQFCAIGSVKSNIGHTSAAAGVAGVQKVLMCMKHKTLVPTLNFSEPNEHFQFEESPLYVNTELKHWETADRKPRRACVSSFGYSGTNAHLVIEEYQSDRNNDPLPDRHHSKLFVLSAKKRQQLKAYAQSMRDFADSNKDINLDDMAYTLQTGREPMDYRMAFLADSREMLIKTLEDYIADIPNTEMYDAHVKTKKSEMKVFETDNDAKALLETWIEKKRLEKLAELWVKGLRINWNELYGDHMPRRISLPAYPFAEEYYWLPNEDAAEKDSRSALPSAARPTKQSLLQKQWQYCPITSAERRSQTVAILANAETRSLAGDLSQYFSSYRIIDSQELEHLSDADWENVGGAVDLIGCGMSHEQSLNWISWLQKLIENGRKHKQELTVLCVTKGLESFENKDVNLSGSSRAGLYRMLQSEYSHLTSRHMDTDHVTAEKELARQIADEFYADSRDTEVCYRDGRRYRAYLDERTADAVNQKELSFPSDQVLLITGGTRGLGLVCARHFVQTYGVKRLVLTGREVMPPREQWEFLKAKNTPLAQKLKAIQELEAMGAQVQVLSLQLSDPLAVKQSIETIQQTMGAIGGVIHCAGAVNKHNPAFIRKSAEEIQAVLEPKVGGLQTLFDLLKDEPLQFFVLFSSVSATVPVLAAGQADYAMANAFMDYFAETHKDKYPIVSIQWPNWKETGLGEVRSKALEQTGLLGLNNEEGLQLLDQILSEKQQAVVLPAIHHTDVWQPGKLMQHSLTDKAFQRAETRESDSAQSLFYGTVEWLVTIFSDELKIGAEDLETDEPFQEYGVDSIILAQLLQQINQKLKGDIDPSILFEYPTIESFAKWLISEYKSALPDAVHSAASKGHVPDAASLPPDQASAAKQQMQKASDIKPALHAEDIAIVGLTCRFPGAETLEAYWDLIRDGRSEIKPVPPGRFGNSSSYYAGVIEDLNRFDPDFFLMSDDDVRAMDPQALAVLEESLKLMYHAGYTEKEMKGMRAGVYIGGRSQHKPDQYSLSKARNPIVAGGQNYLAANISQFFDLRGPSIVLDTACSSALVGMNMAIQALRSGDIEAAVVGGVSLLDTDAHRMFQERGLLSDKPSFHVFDKRAEGVVLGEGVGMVLVKTVSQALEDGDSIYAVIKAAAVNNDGRTAGPSAPNLEAQKDVMLSALEKSGKKPKEISYLEANGSGSVVTDLLELKAIQAIYRSRCNAPLGLGSVKPNIGHPLCAEGIASLIKVALMLKHRQLVPFLSGDEKMTHFNIEETDLYFCKTQAEWKEKTPAAAINCFADGGTNAHLIIEAWDDSADRPIRRKPLPLPALHRRPVLTENRALSAQTERGQGFSDKGAPKEMFWKTFK
ncbi:SDR family NAD(P)-dependent oxidoreductase [Bacillus halotolerans]|uniref:SDR family NAD(P)-dependent oxidoreductase n=1 Tax=Bacillus halotolerans TaxID=260554 RepID=A0ABY7I540_9BACI|nr:type I polyketide synthase [Bacillus halotolerans]WAT23108.1 SDR family NAD(P)-dependent oxidoreductase [Bacillus halotolerans]